MPLADRPRIVARHYATGTWVGLRIDGPTITEVEPAEGTIRSDDLDPWIAPAFWDLQVNGRWGVSFSDATITPEQVARIVRAQAALGTARLCPTLITASREATLSGVKAIAQACDSDPEVGRRVLGIHLEGPWISPEDGYRGAHPREHVRDPDWEEFLALQDAAGGRIALVTLAPERPGGLELVERLAEAEVLVAVGHSAADGATLEAACRAGLRLATHLGNGLPATLNRHPNPIWDQAARPDLWASFIADGHHLDRATLGVLVRAKRQRFLLVSDASPLAGSPPGLYGPWEVREDGRIVVAGTPYLAGSSLELPRAIPILMAAASVDLRRAIRAATSSPARLLGHKPPEIGNEEPADLILFRFRKTRSTKATRSFDLLASCVGGEWNLAGAEA